MKWRLQPGQVMRARTRPARLPALGARRTERPSRVWALNAAMAVACAGLVAGPVRDFDAIASAGIPWIVLAAAVTATERWPVHLEFRRSAHSFSLTDVPVTLALVFASGLGGVGAIALGSSLALALRRLPAVKFAFNLVQFVLTTALAYVLVHAVAGGDPSFGPLVWLAVFAALQICGLVTIALISGAMWLSEGSLSREQVRQMFGMDALVTATNSSIALLLSVVVIEQPEAAPIALIPLAIVFAGYRSYVVERQRHEKLQFLYEAHRTLSQSREVAQALVGLLERAMEAYRAEQAEVILFAADGSAPLRTSLGPDGAHERMEPVDAAAATALRAALEGRAKPIAIDADDPGPARGYLRSRGIRHAMLAALQGEERTVGLLLLANRSGVSRRFTEDDVALFDTLAANASAALQYDRLEQAVADLRALQDELHHQAFHDPLTGLANRALFREAVGAALSERGHRGVAVLFIDLDDFKTINDTLGHAVGDQLLLAAGRRLSGCIRGDDLVARLGGDEFAVLCRSSRDPERDSVEVADRVLAAFDVPVAVAQHVLPIRLSVGVATTAHSGDRPEDMLRDADVAMYEAKEGGKARYAVFDPAMREVVVRRHDLRKELEQALVDGQLRVRYQPIMDIGTGQVRAMEALVRWQHPERGLLSPIEFIPLAEETGLIIPLGRVVLEAACRRAQTWASDLAVQVNLSARELEDGEVVDTVTSVIESTGIDPRRLILEITETLLIRDAERGAAKLNALRDVGVRLALDDFGTGYSSLSYLRMLPLDVLKIAHEFVDGIAVSPDDAAFVRLIVDLAGTVGLTVIAEGIESPEQLDVLRRLGCDQGQGYLYAAPLEDEEPWLRERRFARAAPHRLDA